WLPDPAPDATFGTSAIGHLYDWYLLQDENITERQFVEKIRNFTPAQLRALLEAYGSDSAVDEKNKAAVRALIKVYGAVLEDPAFWDRYQKIAQRLFTTNPPENPVYEMFSVWVQVPLVREAMVRSIDSAEFLAFRIFLERHYHINPNQHLADVL